MRVMTSSRIRNQIFRYLLISLFIPILFSCTQPEGYGGSSGIEGVLMTQYYNNDYSILISEEPAVDEDVFILFGDSDFLGDKVATSSTGAFEFPFLREGDYQLYFMSEDSSTVSDDEVVVIMDLNLQTGKVSDQGTIYRFETLDWDDGSAKLTGLVKVINYKNTTIYPFLEIKDISLAQELEVYLIYGDHEYYDDRIRTNYDGVFEFVDLIPGDYTVFVYSEDVTGGTEDIAIIKQATITTAGEVINMGEFTIEKL